MAKTRRRIRRTRRKQRGAGGAGSKPANAPAQAAAPTTGTRANRNARRAEREADRAAKRALRQSARELHAEQLAAAKVLYEADKAKFIKDTLAQHLGSKMAQKDAELLTKTELVQWAFANPVSKYVAKLKAEAEAELEELEEMPNMWNKI